MYIEDKYWDNCIGQTEDSLTLIDYLADKHKDEITIREIFADIGLDKLNGNFREHEEPLTAVLKNIDSDYDEPEVEFYYAIDIISDIAALLLECKINGTVNLCELNGSELDTDTPDIRISATPEEHKIINDVLKDFVANPLAYDVTEIEEPEDTRATAAVCKALREELYGQESYTDDR